VVAVIPFTSIIEQTAAVYRGALGTLGGAVLEHHSAFEMTGEGAWADNRTGPDRLRLAMERRDSPIAVTTAVQFFESLFSDRPSRCRKLHSLARRVVVIDEVQTMPLPLLRPCVAALKELARNYGTSVVLCTATQPALDAPTSDNRRFSGGFKAPCDCTEYRHAGRCGTCGTDRGKPAGTTHRQPACACASVIRGDPPSARCATFVDLYAQRASNAWFPPV
jgi:CRISPR-associated endonuclease/helicase Cas3